MMYTVTNQYGNLTEEIFLGSLLQKLEKRV